MRNCYRIVCWTDETFNPWPETDLYFSKEKLLKENDEVIKNWIEERERPNSLKTYKKQLFDRGYTDGEEDIGCWLEVEELSIVEKNDRPRNPLTELRHLLDEAGIPYKNNPESFMFSIMDRVCYMRDENVICSAIWGPNSYGYEEGQIEIMGLLTEEEQERDNVVGYLTPEEVFRRIKEDWERF